MSDANFRLRELDAADLLGRLLDYEDVFKEHIFLGADGFIETLRGLRDSVLKGNNENDVG